MFLGTRMVTRAIGSLALAAVTSAEKRVERGAAVGRGDEPAPMSVGLY